MARTVARKSQPRHGGRFSPTQLSLFEELLIDAQAVLDRSRSSNARQAQLLRAAAAEHERMASAETAVLHALCASIVNVRERVA